MNSPMKILITGNQGYLGPVVCRHLREALPQARLIGFDTGYFKDCYTVKTLTRLERPHEQVEGDVRHFPAALLKGVDAVLHLAAISNDPMGKQFEKATLEVNYESSVSLATLAKQKGVGRFVFASSCSVYGIDDGTLKSEQSSIHPLSAYAQSKTRSEEKLATLADSGFSVTALRFATACGFSPRCRLDLVLNDFVASALSHGKITLLSDGTPWRPLIHVGDMARAMEWALCRTGGPAFLALNAGSRKWNYQVKELAQAVSERVGRVPVELKSDAGPDKRSYRVDFSLFEKFAPHHQPKWTLAAAIDDLVQGLKPVISKGMDIRASEYVRLNVLSQLMGAQQIDANLNWIR